MSGKTFIIFLVVVATMIAFAISALFDDDPIVAPPLGNGNAVEIDRSDDPVEGPDTPLDPRSDNGTSDPLNTRTPVTPGKLPDFEPNAEFVISGTVTSALDGSPVAEAEVEALYPDGDVLDSIETAEDGTYRLEIPDGVPARIDYRCLAMGYSILPMRGERISKDARELTVDFVLQPWFKIQGRVTSVADGLPVEGADVEIRSLSPMFQDEWEDAETDALGYYEISEIEDLPREGLDAWAESSFHAPMVKQNITLPAGQNVLQIDFELWGTITLRGTVVSGATGEPIPDAEVSAASSDPEFMDDGEDDITTEEGAFELELDSVPYEGMFVLISAMDFGAIQVGDLPAPDKNGVIDLGRVRLPTMVTLRGMVINGPNGRAVPGGDITVYSVHAPDREDGDYVDGVMIEGDGRFEFPLEYAPASGSEVLIEADGFFPLRAPLEIPPHVREFDVIYQVEPVVMFTGKVTREVDGSAVAGARVRLLTSRDAEEEAILGRAAADGSFQIDLPEGEASRFAVVVEYIGERFTFGTLENPPAGSFQITRDFVVDLPPLGRRKR